MKLTDNFDARRLRPREPRRWRSRFGMLLALLLIIFGALLTLAGAASLLGIKQFDGMMLEAEMAIASLLLGLFLLWIGLFIRRGIRRRLYGPSGISLSPRLGKKR
ncbi:MULTISPECIES: hypothetical protein [Pseudomonadaceae]|jgi:hypothetical protein|uniref:Uncharacterized protein n=1 Tax=Pseudomonas saudiphocaensis TaxID=1499686 RepID=A0A078LRP0_9PSED|nr:MULTISPECIES: hypothetical protein [Pseudomonadaceae]MCF6783648.1 hypothetical protein [Stutzerimonas stutzeri]MCF6806498.1 hypothetical protein [Stutzerimonas stutzeri]RRV12139.1 hypothetical protein EGJ00_16705 [Pseudomonas saudiphocaensis]CDZ93925.1 hypothetical protein BN1079_01230 [Pseudomonas saudiphocaensis]